MTQFYLSLHLKSEKVRVFIPHISSIILKGLVVFVITGGNTYNIEFKEYSKSEEAFESMTAAINSCYEKMNNLEEKKNFVCTHEDVGAY